MSVWLASQADIEPVLNLLRECHAASVYAHIPFDRDYSRTLLRSLMDAERALVLTNGTAVLIVALIPLHFAPGWQANEVAFWGKNGGELIEPAKAWAKERGAVRMIINAEHGPRQKALGRWYQRHGFKPDGQSYEVSLWASQPT
jgi:GNAT superfamily N-acetyltransferase